MALAPLPAYDAAERTVAPGIVERRARRGRISYKATVWDNAAGKRLVATRATLREAKAWQRETRVALERGELHARSPLKVADAVASWLTAARAGTIRGRSGQLYRPSTLRGYEQSFRDHVLPALGDVRLSDLRTPAVQAMVDSMVAADAAPQTVRNAITALRVVLGDAVRREQLAVSPIANVRLPAGAKTVRDRVVPVTEARELLAVLEHPADRALWATALFAGLRRGELLGLERQDVSLAKRELRVERTIHPETRTEHDGAKTAAGRRTVPIIAALLPYLNEPSLRDRIGGPAFPDPETGETMRYDHLIRRAKRAWKRAGLEPVSLHEARHSAISLMVASGVNIKVVQAIAGHANIAVTLDRYSHLMPDAHAAAAAQVDAYLGA